MLTIVLLALTNSTYLHAENLTITEKKIIVKEIFNQNKNISNKEASIILREKVRELIYKKKLQKEKEQRESIVREKIKKVMEKKRQLLAEKKIELNSAAEKEFFPHNFDISDQMKYKRIQERALSCELSAASDILSFFENKEVSESYVISLVQKSYYNKLPEIVNNKRIW